MSRLLETMCAFSSSLKNQLILLFNLFLLVFMSSTVFFNIIHRFYCTISTNFYFYLQYFQQKIFNFSKINGYQIDPLYMLIGSFKHCLLVSPWVCGIAFESIKCWKLTMTKMAWKMAQVLYLPQ